MSRLPAPSPAASEDDSTVVNSSKSSGVPAKRKKTALTEADKADFISDSLRRRLSQDGKGSSAQ